MTTHEHAGEKRTYVIVYIILMVLLALTVGLSTLPMRGYEAIPAYLIAVVKTVLVMIFFMELRRSIRLTWVVAGAAFVWLGIMLVLTAADYATRGWTPESEFIRDVRRPIIPPPAPNRSAGPAAGSGALAAPFLSQGACEVQPGPAARAGGS